jgi:hypothetical protein
MTPIQPARAAVPVPVGASIWNALRVAVSHVVLHPEDWDGLEDAMRTQYSDVAAERWIELQIAEPGTLTPVGVTVVISNGDFTSFAVPLYLGPVLCDRPHWEHNLRDLLDMDDHCFPNPFRDDPGSIRSL